jgi:hypothetical protein
MIRCKYYPTHRSEVMPEFTTVSVKEARMRTIPGRKGTFINEYADYIQQISAGQAGKLRLGESEKHATIRRRLSVAATAMDIPLIIKRSGNDVYFWREGTEEEQPRRKRRYTRRSRTDAETATPEQYFKETGELDHEVPAEESPESGQLASEAERRVAQG